MHDDATSNPIGPFSFQASEPTIIHQPSPDVAEKQDPEHTEGDFMRDLGKATQQKSEA
ncbi:MAG: hypothetical protein ACOYD4_09235 [Solirubrobacterales bacterium]